jgi:hypothetical protein
VGTDGLLGGTGGCGVKSDPVKSGFIFPILSIAPEPLCHAHIALDGGHLTTILESVASLTKALQWAIKMLKEEVFDAMSAIRR